MKLVVLGANGRTGRCVVQAALDRGHEVVTVVRSQARCPGIRHKRLRTAVGDPGQRAFLSRVLRDQDAVISTLGARRPTRRAAAIYWMSADALTAAATETGLDRIVVTFTALLFPPQTLRHRLLVGMVRPVEQSARRMERALEASGLHVVFARCGFLTDRDVEGYRAEPDALPVHGGAIPRSGLA